MGRRAVDIVLEQFHILENGMIDPLEDIVVHAVRLDEEGVVDEAVAERLDFEDVARDVKLEGNLFQLFCGFHEETT